MPRLHGLMISSPAPKGDAQRFTNPSATSIMVEVSMSKDMGGNDLPFEGREDLPGRETTASVNKDAAGQIGVDQIRAHQRKA